MIDLARWSITMARDRDREATALQPAARVALGAAAAAPFHAYLLVGPPGAGKAPPRGRWPPSCSPRACPTPTTLAAARSPIRRRTPTSSGCDRRGTQHLVEDVRERVIGQVAYRPFEAERRVFVIEAADAMAEESQNALLKTLEEPPPFAHLILVSAEPEALLETVRSRCREVRFDRLGPEAVEDAARRARRALSAPPPPGSPPATWPRARFCSPTRAACCARRPRRSPSRLAPASSRARRGTRSPRPPMLRPRPRRPRCATRYEQAEEEEAERSGPAARRRAREAEEGAKRASRRARTETLDLGLALLGCVDARPRRCCGGRARRSCSTRIVRRCSRSSAPASTGAAPAAPASSCSTPAAACR